MQRTECVWTARTTRIIPWVSRRGRCVREVRAGTVPSSPSGRRFKLTKQYRRADADDGAGGAPYPRVGASMRITTHCATTRYLTANGLPCEAAPTSLIGNPCCSSRGDTAKTWRGVT
jgi:hypothetical protein